MSRRRPWTNALVGALSLLVVGGTAYSLLAACAPAPKPVVQAPKPKPKSFVEGYEGEWKVIELRENIDDKTAWQTTVDVVAVNLDIETLDQTSGYIRSGWKIGYGMRSNSEDFQSYRARVVIKFEPGFKRARVKTEAEWQGARGSDSRLLSDIYSDLQGRIGRVVR